MRERPETDVATLAARCPVVVDHPFATRLKLAVLAAAALLWPLAIFALARDWPRPAQALAGVLLAGGLAFLVVLARHTCRTGSFRLAADEHQLYFREALADGVRALQWHRCRDLELIPARGGHALRFEFERHVNERTWTSIRHARVFVRDTSVAIVTTGLPDAAALAERLEALRHATDGAPATVHGPRRAAA